MIARLGGWCFAHRRIVAVVWIVLLAGSTIASTLVGSAYSADFDVPASESADGLATVQEFFPGKGGARGGSIVFSSAEGIDQPDVQAVTEQYSQEVGEIDQTSIVSPYSEFGVQQVSPDRTIAFAQVNFGAGVDPTETADIGREIRGMTPELSSEGTSAGTQEEADAPDVAVPVEPSGAASPVVERVRGRHAVVSPGCSRAQHPSWLLRRGELRGGHNRTAGI